MLFKLLKQKGTLLLLFPSLFIIELTIPQLTVAQNNSSDLKDTIDFGFAEDAYPISSLRGERLEPQITPNTLCYELYKYLTEAKNFKYTYNKKLGDFQFRLVPVSYKDRFSSDRGIYCGAISNTLDRRANNLSHDDNREFSITYSKDPSRFIIRRDMFDKLKPQLEEASERNNDEKTDIGSGNKIAVIGNTTQYDFLKKNFKETNIKTFETRVELYDALQETSQIVAYITDDIILKAILTKYPEIRKKYKYDNSFDGEIEKLSVLIYDPKLSLIVNEWINNTGKEWVNNKHQELDQQLENEVNKLESKSILDITKTHLIIVICICTIITFLIIFSFWRKNKSRSPAVSKSSNTNIEQNRDNPIQQIINNISHNISHRVENTMNNNDQSQKLSIGGDVIKSPFNQVSNAVINQNSNNKSQELILELEQMQKLIKSNPSLNEEQKTEVLEEIQHIKQATQNPDNEQMKRQAKSAWRCLKLIPAGLKNANEIVEQLNKLLPHIQDIFGF